MTTNWAKSFEEIINARLTKEPFEFSHFAQGKTSLDRRHSQYCLLSIILCTQVKSTHVRLL